MKIAVVLLVMLVILNGSFAKKKVPGCKGNKKALCKKLSQMTEDFEECENEKKELQKEIDEESAENDRLEKELEKLQEDNGKLEKEKEEESAENERLKEENDKLKEQIQECEKSKDELIEKNEDYEKQLAECNKPEPTDAPAVKAPKSCVEHKNAGKTTSGWYMIDPDGQGAFEVYCDQVSQGGGWAIIQRRNGGSVDFFLGWNEYKDGFGSKTEWWTGLDKIHRMTGQGCDLRVGLIDLQGNSAQALFNGFSVGPESSDYQLTSGRFAGGTAGDSMSYHNDRKFSTKDRDNDVANSNCAVSLNGGWWYSGIGAKCADANLNGQYGKNVFYRSWKGGNYSLMKTAMRVRC